MEGNEWDAAVKKHYGYASVEQLEADWMRQETAKNTGNKIGPLLAREAEQRAVSLSVAIGAN